MRRNSKKPRAPPYILGLPLELLSDIFLAYHSLVAHQFNIPSDNSVARKLLILGSICQTFRAAAWSTSHLWTHIVIALHPGLDTERFSSIVRGFEAWLSRAGTQLPLYIYLKCVSVSQYPIQLTPLFVVMDRLVGHCHRWRELYLSLPRACLARMGDVTRIEGQQMVTVHRACRLDMPMLRKVALFGSSQHEYAFYDTTGDEIINVFEAAEQLGEIGLSNFPKSTLVFPWRRLRRFKCHQNSLEDVLAALAETQELVECNLAGVADITRVTPLSPVCLPHLRALTVTRDISPINYLVLPALETLSLQMDETRLGEDGDEDDMDDMASVVEWEATIYASDFVGLISRSGCTLRCLHLSVSFLPVATLMECLRTTPQLTEFRLEHADEGRSMNPNFMDRFVQRLTPRAGSATIVPELSRLEVLKCSSSFRAHDLGEMLWLRWGAGEGERGCLEFFKLEISGIPGSVMMPEDVVGNERMRDIVEHGMIVEVQRGSV